MSQTQHEKIKLLAQQIEEQVRAGRFAEKIVNEISSLKASRVILQRQGSDLLVNFVNNSETKKIVKLSESWFDLIFGYLKARWLSVADQSASFNYDNIKNSKFKSAIRTAESLTILDVQQLSPNELQLNSFESITPDQIADFFHFDQISLEHSKELAKLNEGLIIICANNSDCLNKAVSTWTAISEAHFIGEIKSQAVRSAINSLVDKDLLSVSLLADSLAVAAKQIATWSELYNNKLPVYLVFNAFPKAVCPTCPGTMRLAVNQFLLDANKQKHDWQPASESDGTFCSSCAGYGYKGWEGVCQVVEIDSDLSKFLMTKPSEVEIQSKLRLKGYRAFSDIVIELALEGKTDVAALTDCRMQPNALANIGETSLPVEDDFFEVVAKPKSLTNQSETSILVVEDDIDQRQILEMALQDIGYSVLVAENGLEALGVLQTQTPSIIITDLMMPKMNGMDLVKKLKAEDHLKDIGVLVLTVLNDADKEYDLLSLGVEDYCEKTTPRKVLMKRIENVVNRRNLSRENS